MFHFVLVALSGKKFDGEVHEVVLPTMDGQIGVLTNHMPLTSVAANGVVMVRKAANVPDAQREYFAINGGAIDIDRNTVRVLVDEADLADDINESEAQKALERAEKMRAEAKDEVSLERAQALIDRQAVRLQVAGLKRRHQK